ncbi:MAG: site-specific integrase, partial [Halobacteriales archaeon]|nr:site-specific integrase [Halobacteriales archaeon]
MAQTEADAIAYFLDDLEHHGKSERTLDAYERVLRRFERFLADERGVSRPRDADRRDCLAFVHRLRGEASRSTIATYASYLHRFYAYMTQVGEFDANPMALVMEEMDESIDKDPARR